MLDNKIQKKLESLTKLPTVPYVISEVLNAVDNSNLSAGALGKLVEKDQALTAKVLSVANSPFYGFSRRISTIDLAIVVIGLNSIKEIVLSLVIQKFFSHVRKDVFDVNDFWHYSVFSGACSRLLARKLGYRLAGEAFVAGLMHDIGILFLVQFFTKEFKEIRKLQKEKELSIIDAEYDVLGCNHCDIGAWFARKWNLPEQLVNAIQNHHTSFINVKIQEDDNDMVPGSKPGEEQLSFADTDQPLTAIVAMTEWFADDMDFKLWAMEDKPSDLFLANEILDDIKKHDLLNPESALEVLKQEISEEYQKASIFKKLPVR